MIYAIGDIHGQFNMLREMLQVLHNLPMREEDQLVFLGDYIDRGENSCAVIETLLEIKNNRPDTVFLKGNHEQLMLDALQSAAGQVSNDLAMMNEATMLWVANGGREMLASYSIPYSPDGMKDWWMNIPKEHLQFIAETTLEYITPRYHFVHAGLLPPGRRWRSSGSDIEPRLWIRELFINSRARFGGRIVVFGHTPQLSGSPLIQANKIGIDTGAVFGGTLTAIEVDPNNSERRFPSHRFLQIPYSITP